MSKNTKKLIKKVDDKKIMYTELSENPNKSIVNILNLWYINCCKLCKNHMEELHWRK